ncbi:MAG: hypothetical protein A2Z70_01290 [Chloroflexi bacterium RBG_13_48_17]|nr:MAG: hypothetical protein A2Z70_01290 [Chloroflexi bacterium RBG_13_48_17]
MVTGCQDRHSAQLALLQCAGASLSLRVVVKSIVRLGGIKSEERLPGRASVGRDATAGGRRSSSPPADRDRERCKEEIGWRDELLPSDWSVIRHPHQVDSVGDSV